MGVCDYIGTQAPCGGATWRGGLDGKVTGGITVTNGIVTQAEANRQPEIAYELQVAENVLLTLDKQVAMLTEKLGPVMSPDGPSSANQAEPFIGAAVTEVGGRIRALNSGMSAVCDSISRIIQRLEV